MDAYVPRDHHKPPEPPADTLRGVAQYCDDLLARYHLWQRSHPDAPPVDCEPVVVCRGLARRLLALAVAGEPIPRDGFRQLGEALGTVDTTRLSYQTNAFGTKTIKRTPELDRKFGRRASNLDG